MITNNDKTTIVNRLWITDFGLMDFKKVNEWLQFPWFKLPWILEPRLVADEADAQVPLWFVSHAWFEPIKLFLACLRRHANIRELCMKQAFAPYWVCAYANNQWVLEDAISDNPRKTSFYKAMQLCHGVLLVLDSNATPFSRIWCCFEESIAVEHLVDDIIELYCISVLSPVITGYSGSCWIKTDIDIANIKGFTGEI